MAEGYLSVSKMLEVKDHHEILESVNVSNATTLLTNATIIEMIY